MLARGCARRWRVKARWLCHSHDFSCVRAAFLPTLVVSAPSSSTSSGVKPGGRRLPFGVPLASTRSYTSSPNESRISATTANIVGKKVGKAVSPSILLTWIAILSARTRSSARHAALRSRLSWSTRAMSSACVRRTERPSSSCSCSCSRRRRVFVSSVTFFSPEGPASSMLDPREPADTPSTSSRSELTLSWPVAAYCLMIIARRSFQSAARRTLPSPLPAGGTPATVPPTSSTTPASLLTPAAVDEEVLPLPPKGSAATATAPSGSSLTAAAPSGSSAADALSGSSTLGATEGLSAFAEAAAAAAASAAASCSARRLAASRSGCLASADTNEDACARASAT